MIPIRPFLAVLLATCATAADAGEASGTLTLAGTTVELKSAVAFAIRAGEKPTTLVLLSEQPIDLKVELASTDPYTTLINDRALDGVTHAKVFVTKERTSISAHKAGDDTQYLASRKFGLEAKVSGGDGTPLHGRLHSTDAGMSVQIDATFSVRISEPGA
jgi:hypothetical protein